MSSSFREFYLGLSQAEREEFARKANVTRGYIEVYLVRADPEKRKQVRKHTMKSLADAGSEISVDAPSYEDLVSYFYLDGVDPRESITA